MRIEEEKSPTPGGNQTHGLEEFFSAGLCSTAVLQHLPHAYILNLFCYVLATLVETSLLFWMYTLRVTSGSSLKCC